MEESRIRVLFVVPTLAVGGAERIITKLLPALDPREFEASLICAGDEGELFQQLTAAGIEATALGFGGARNAHRALLGLARHMRRNRPDVIVCSGAGTSIIGRLAGLFNRVRHQILWVHESINIDHRSLLREISDRALIPFTSKFLGVTDSQINFLSSVRGYPLEKIHIIRPGVAIKDFDAGTGVDLAAELGTELGCPVVAMVARLHPVKDHATFLAAARIVLQSLPETQFLILGDGPQRKELEDLCKTLEIEERVHFAGSHADVDRLLPAVDIHVLSSHSESLPMSVLEGMACGRPVVCTKVGGTSEILEHGVSGYLVPPGDPIGLARQLTALLTNPGLADRVGVAGRRRVESEFTFEESVTKTQGLLVDLVRSKKAFDLCRTQP